MWLADSLVGWVYSPTAAFIPMVGEYTRVHPPCLFTESFHVCFIVRNPSRHLLRSKLPRLGHRPTLCAEPGGQEQQQFLLLLRSQGVGRRFDLGKRGHTKTIARSCAGDKEDRGGCASRALQGCFHTN